MQVFPSCSGAASTTNFTGINVRPRQLFSFTDAPGWLWSRTYISYPCAQEAFTHMHRLMRFVIARDTQQLYHLKSLPLKSDVTCLFDSPDVAWAISLLGWNATSGLIEDEVVVNREWYRSPSGTESHEDRWRLSELLDFSSILQTSSPSKVSLCQKSAVQCPTPTVAFCWKSCRI